MKQKIKNKVVYIWDNGGETLDRYTILINATGDVYGCSENAAGFAMYNHNVADQYWGHAFGWTWRSQLNVRRSINFAVARYVDIADNLGEFVKFENLSEGAQNYIKSIL
jgi:hypothetical protein